MVKVYGDVRLELRRLDFHVSVKPPEPIVRRGVNAPQGYAVDVFDERRAAVSPISQVHRLYVLLEAGLIAFSNACFEFADEGSDDAQHGSLANPLKILAGYLHGLSAMVK